MSFMEKITGVFTGGFYATKALMLAVAAFFAHYLWIRRRKDKAEAESAHLKDKVELMKVEKDIKKEEERIDEEASKHTAREGIDLYLNDEL